MNRVIEAKRIAGLLGVVVGLPFSAPVAAAADALATELCPILHTLVPQISTYAPEGARAQLVMAVAERYDADPEKLREVRAGIDAATGASCASDRDAMLGILKTGSLAEALD